MKAYIFIFSLFLFVSGCATMQKSESFPKINELSPNQPVASIVVENYGYYLFGIWPLWCGDVENPNSAGCDWFTDTVTVDNNVKLIEREALSYGAESTLGELKTEVETSGSFSAWILWRKIITTSACVYKIDTTKAKVNKYNLSEQIINK